MSLRLLVVVGARPNFVKVAPVLWALARHPRVETVLLHTGQHYDRVMAGSFLEQLQMPIPDHSLGVGPGTHAEQTAAVLVGVERVLTAERHDAILVAGDVNSTMAAALAAAKAGVPIIHLESGLRSGDWSMPEEVNRVITDRISDLLLCHCQEAVDNLATEGIAGEDRVALVGNTMIDSLFAMRDRAASTRTVEHLGVRRGGYVLATLHRPALVDDAEALSAVVEVLSEMARVMPVVFPVHPRTRATLAASAPPGVGTLTIVEPQEYLSFVDLESAARLVLTDSGGVQEETSALGIPCLTYRTSTERAVTIELGTNRLVGTDPDELRAAFTDFLQSPPAPAPPIPLWDGHAGPRAALAIVERFDRE